MKIGIHHRQGSFSDRWIDYCKAHNIDFKIVDCHRSDIIQQLEDCDALMWHYHHAIFKDLFVAKGLLFSLEQAGKIVFPNFNTNWHFDNKVAQKYLLEAVDAPLVKSYAFYSKREALQWARTTEFPKVFKLKGGAGSKNVYLVRNFRQCVRIVNKAFSTGFPAVDKIRNLRERWRLFQNGKTDFMGLLRAIGKLFFLPSQQGFLPNEKGYAYFQDFIPNNSFDIRVIIVSGRAFALKRGVREGDFRASGSGFISYSKNEINPKCVRIAFDVTERLRAQSVAYDFVFDNENNPLIVEISYGFAMSSYDKCEGYWNKDLEWCSGPINPQEWMIEELLTEITSKKVTKGLL